MALQSCIVFLVFRCLISTHLRVPSDRLAFCFILANVISQIPDFLRCLISNFGDCLPKVSNLVVFFLNDSIQSGSFGLCNGFAVLCTVLDVPIFHTQFSIVLFDYLESADLILDLIAFFCQLRIGDLQSMTVLFFDFKLLFHSFQPNNLIPQVFVHLSCLQNLSDMFLLLPLGLQNHSLLILLTNQQIVTQLVNLHVCFLEAVSQFLLHFGSLVHLCVFFSNIVFHFQNLALLFSQLLVNLLQKTVLLTQR